MYNEFLNYTGLIYLSDKNQIILLVALGIGCTIMGFVSDRMLNSVGFGPIGNGLLLLVGFAACAILFNHYAPYYQMRTLMHFVMAVGIGPFLLLIVMAFAKRIVARV